MFQLLQADIYRIYKERNLLIPTIIIAFISSVMGSRGDFRGSYDDLIVVGVFILIPFIIHTFSVVWSQNFRARTVNNILINGTKRSTYFISKIVLNILLLFYYLIVMWGAFFITGLIKGSSLKGTGYMFKDIFAQIPMYITIILLASVIFITLKKDHVSTTITVMGLMFGEDLLSGLLYKISPALQESAQKYFLLSNLMNTSQDFFNPVNAYVPCLVLSLVALVIGIAYFNKREFA